MKPCIDLDHIGEDELFPDDFYAHAAYADGRMNRCKTCCKRRATVIQSKRRQARRDEGLPVCDVAYHNLMIRQRLEATYQHSASEEQPCPTEGQDVVFFDQPEFRVESGFSSLIALMPWLHQGKARPKYSRA